MLANEHRSNGDHKMSAFGPHTRTTIPHARRLVAMVPSIVITSCPWLRGPFSSYVSPTMSARPIL
jgi:hypothetical protein